MDDYEINNVGAIGLMEDLPEHSLPPEAFTLLLNMRCHDNKLVKLAGQEEVMATPTITPYYLLNLVDPVQVWWVYASLDTISVWDGTAHTDVSRASGYNATAAEQWDGTVLGGIPIINNGIDVPQYWPAYNKTTLFADLVNWPAGWTAKAVKAFGPFLVALNVAKSGTRYPHLVQWSHPAAPGTLPTSWDHTDPTVDAGNYELPDSRAGLLLNGGPLRGQMYLYKEQAIWRMQFIGGEYVFRFESFVESNGMIGPKAFTLTPDGLKHAVLMQDDLIVHDGQSTQSLLTNRVRREFFQRLDGSQAHKSFLFTNPEFREVWVCYPEVGSTKCNRALIWNQENGALSEATIDFDCAEAGYIETGDVDIWDDVPATITTWDDWVGLWNVKDARRVVVGNATATKFFRLDTSGQRNGSNYPARARRANLSIMGQDRTGKPIQDYKQLKMYRRVWIKASGDPFFVRVGVQQEIDGAITWMRRQLFTPATDQYVDFVQSGRALAIEFFSRDSGLWQVHGYKPEVVPLGNF